MSDNVKNYFPTPESIREYDYVKICESITHEDYDTLTKIYDLITSDCIEGDFISTLKSICDIRDWEAGSRAYRNSGQGQDKVKTTIEGIRNSYEEPSIQTLMSEYDKIRTEEKLIRYKILGSIDRKDLYEYINEIESREV